MKIRLSNITYAGGVFTADLDLADGPPTDQPVPHSTELPLGYNTDRAVGLFMLKAAMHAYGWTPISVQGRGAKIIEALKLTYPALDVYLSTSDAPVWPGFGSLDVTIDSGKGGWSFRPDGVTPWKAPPR